MEVSENNATINGSVEEWVKNYLGEMLSWARYKTSSSEIAEDLVQDTFVAALKNVKGFRGESTAKTWLFSILNNKIKDHYRKASVQREEKTIDKYSNDTGHQDIQFTENGKWKSYPDAYVPFENEKHLLDDEAFNEVLKSCFEELPDKWHKVMSYKYLLHKESEEICKELNITPSNYWQIVRRSKIRLRECLSKKWEIQ